MVASFGLNWLIKSELTSVQIRDALSPFIDADYKLLVINITGDNWATIGIKKTGNDWLHAHL